MKSLTFLVCVSALALTWDAQATEVGNGRDMGIGFSIGEPTGIVGKLFVGPENAIDVGLSFYRAYGRCDVNGKFDRCSGDSNLGINVDYLWQYNLLAGAARLDWHLGVGGRVWVWNNDANASNFALAARMPIGIDFMPPKPDFLEVFLEFTPVLYVAPGVGPDLEAALGVRFYF